MPKQCIVWKWILTLIKNIWNSLTFPIVLRVRHSFKYIQVHTQSNPLHAVHYSIAIHTTIGLYTTTDGKIVTEDNSIVLSDPHNRLHSGLVWEFSCSPMIFLR